MESLIGGQGMLAKNEVFYRKRYFLLYNIFWNVFLFALIVFIYLKKLKIQNVFFNE